MAVIIYWNRFGEWVTELKNDPFQRARLKLTVFYTVVIVLSIIFYLGLLYREFYREAKDFAIENVPKKRQELFFHRASQVASITLFSVQPEDIAMFIVIIYISYLLAGIALKPIKDIVRREKQFLADASHELKTPLTIIRTEMEIFLRDKNHSQTRDRESVKSNLEEIERMKQIITNLLAIARMDSYKPDFQFARINLQDILIPVSKKLSESARMKNITFTLNKGESIQVFVDKTRIELGFFNILSNAIKYTKDGGTITVSLTKGKRFASIEVRDTGVGIAKEDLPHIFQRFFRGTSQYSKRVSGTGLGLAITKLIVTKHNGRISIESELDKGTTVTVLLPLSH